MPTITVHAHGPSDVSTAFAYISDYVNTPNWFYGIKSFVPVTEETRAVGATFDAVIHIGATLKSTVQVVEFVENEVFSLDSIKGIKNASRWTFSEREGGGTDVNVDFSYSLGSGIAGAALSKLVEPFVAIAVKHTTNTLIAQLN